MNKFSIKAVERLSGIKAHTIRVWEQRYGLLEPDRRQGNHRVYSNDDLKSLLKVVYLYNLGHKIRSLATLNTEEINDLIQAKKSKEKWDDFSVVLLIEAVLDLNENAFAEVISDLEKKHDFESIMIHFLFPLLKRIGVMWVTDRVLPGQEHFASNMIIRKVLEATNRLEESQLQKAGSVLLLAPEGEFHEISLLFMQYLLKKNGYQTIYLGANTSLEIVDLFYRKHQPSHIYVHLVANLQEESPEKYLKILREMFPQVYLIANGEVFRNTPVTMEGMRILQSEEDLLDFSYNIFNFTD